MTILDAVLRLGAVLAATSVVLFVIGSLLILVALIVTPGEMPNYKTERKWWRLIWYIAAFWIAMLWAYLAHILKV